MSKKPIIGFAGMTHLGLNSAVAAADRGFDIVCFDADAARIADLKKGETTINEPDLLRLMRTHAARLTFTSNAADLAACDIVYISLDVPTNDQAVSDLAPVRAMIDRVNGHLTADALLVVLCQVPPAFTRSIARDPARLFYQVETLIFGQAVARALYPERYMIGCADPSVPLPAAFASYLAAYECPILPMRYESAELAKTAINLFLAASVSTANTLAEVCEKIGADWQEIIPSLRLDKRIGHHAYIATGLGLSGGNIERDLRTVSQLGEQHGGNATIPMAYLEHSHYRKQWPIQHVLSAAQGRTDFKLCVLGLAYKNDTHSTKNSPAITLIEGMPAGIDIVAYDPVVTSLPQHPRVTIAKSAADAMKDADAVCVMTAWDAFKTMDWSRAKTAMRGTTLIDPYGLIAPAHAHGFTHRVMGKA